MTDTPWRDAYDDPEGMACALERLSERLLEKSAIVGGCEDVDAAAACIRELAERIAELEAENEGLAQAMRTVRIARVLDEQAPATPPDDLAALSGRPAPEQEVEGDRGELINAIREAREEIEDVRDRLPEDEVILDTIHGADQALEDCERYLFDCARPTPAPRLPWVSVDNGLRLEAERMVNELDRARRIGPVPTAATLRVWAARLRKALTPERPGQEGGE